MAGLWDSGCRKKIEELTLIYRRLIMKKYLRNFLILYFIVIFLFIIFTQNRTLYSEKKTSEKFTGIYLGKTPPGSKAEIFDAHETIVEIQVNLSRS